MKYALVNQIKAEAQKGAKGICPSCGSELIAKCGDQKINHWAHKGNRNCDPWWEPETEWHRSWKNNFDVEWQEVSLTDENTGERHIADVRTAHNLVIEFQHSSIIPEERQSREKFYKEMVWVVDGTRLKRDKPRFLKWMQYYHIKNKYLYTIEFPDEVFPKNWLDSTVPIIFDFKGLENTIYNDNLNQLYCLFPLRRNGYVDFEIISRNAFIKSTINGDWSDRVKRYIEEKKHPKQIEQKQIVSTNLQNIRRQEPTHYYEPRKGKFVKRNRF